MNQQTSEETEAHRIESERLHDAIMRRILHLSMHPQEVAQLRAELCCVQAGAVVACPGRWRGRALWIGSEESEEEGTGLENGMPGLGMRIAKGRKAF